MLTKADIYHRQVVLLNTLENKYHLCIIQGNLVIKNNDEILTRISKQQAFAVMVIGNCSITSVMIDYCQKHGIALIFLNSRLRPILFASLSGEANFLLRQKQYLSTKIIHQKIANHLVYNKIYNHIQLIKNIRQKDDIIKKAIIDLSDYQDKCYGMEQLDGLMGIEGNAARMYFKCYFGQLKHHAWQSRKPRLKIDPVNVVLDMGYTLLFNYMEANLRLFGFDVYKGMLHQLWFKRKSLVCDFVEPFRCIIDRQVLIAFNLGQFRSEHFSQVKMQYQLKNKHSKEYHAILMKSIIEYKMEIFIYVRDFYRAIMKISENNIDVPLPLFDINIKHQE